MANDGQVRVLFCDACGAPLEARAFDAYVLCRYCSSNNAVGSPSPSAVMDDGRPRINVGGRTYVVEGRMARGDACDVYRARWAMRLGELVVLKVNRSLRDGDRVRRAVETLEWLHEAADASTAGIASRLPTPIALGHDRRDGVDRPIAVYEWKSGFVHTLEEVKTAWPAGVDGRIGVWVFRRLLELLGYVHRSGYVHGAVLPPHVLVHPRDHGAILVGWGSAVRQGQPLAAISRGWSGGGPSSALWPAAFYPHGKQVSPRTDLAQAAMCALAVTSSFARPAAELLEAVAQERAGDDAWDLVERLKQASRDAYGPPSYNPLPMPGWA